MKKQLLILVFIIFTSTSFSQTTYTVNSIDDLADDNINDAVCADVNGNCTLRAAIQNANKASNKDIIEFSISGTAPFTILLSSELPTIGYPVVIDGRTQAEYSISNSPVIEIDGSGLPINNSGLKLYGFSDNSEIYGLSIGGFQRLDVSPFSGGIGIDVYSPNHIIQSNYIGLKPDGTTLSPNQWGVYFFNSGNNTFGGIGDFEGNVVSGNYSGGVTFDGVDSSNNTVQGNLLGTDATGMLPRGNRFNLQLLNAPNNTIGGNIPEARNILSAGVNNQSAQTDGTGISISGVNSTNNTIIGNYIGTDITGNGALENMRGGILLLFGANNNIIGTDNAGEGNIISGNGFYGIYLQGSTANPVDSNSIKGNYIGVDATGNVALPNSVGIMMLTGENNNNIIGGITANSKNVISGNSNSGIAILSGNNNQIIGNYIGTNASGASAVANSFGIVIEDENNTIGGQASGSRNIISGNSTGISVSASTSDGTVVLGNYIGLNAAGNGLLPNTIGVSLSATSINTTIGGTDPLDRNIISGNSNFGISVGGSSHNIKNNYIGLNPAGDAAFPNAIGISFISSSTNCAIGGANLLDKNIISGNSNIGISVSGTSHNIQNNYIGLNPAGDVVLNNGNEGLRLSGNLTDTQVSENTISGNGTTTSSSRNVYFNSANGAQFFNNNVGTLPDGNTAVTNIGVGIALNNSSNNIIGGVSEIEGNIIGNHSLSAVQMVFNCNDNTVSHNKIGVGLDGVSDIGNSLIGVTISGTNTGNAITNNTIANNLKGVELSPSLGISTQVRISENSMFNNSEIGIDLVGTTENDVNDPDEGVNNLQNTPEISMINFLGGTDMEITYAVPSSVSNSSYPLTVEFFGAVNGQGKFFIESDTYTATGSKTVTINLPNGFDVDDYINIVATATDSNGNTSEFGAPLDSTLSVTQLQDYNIKVYPNPVSDQLFIQLGDSGSHILKVVNALGQIVLTKKTDTSSTALNVNNLSNGLYFLNIDSENGSSQTLKFIKN